MKKRIFSLLMVCCMVCAMIVPAQAAASASLTGSNTIKPGDSVVLTLSVSGGNIYGLSGKLTYSDNLTFTDYSCSADGWSKEEHGGNFSAFGTNATSGAILTVTLKASSSAKSGDTFSASFKDIVVSDGEKDNSLSSTSWSGSVAAPPSNNCDLRAIECYSGTMVPAYNKNTTYYTVTVPYEVEKLSYDYFRADTTQKVTIGGSSNLVVGENTLTFTVKAASGATKTYTLVATREQDPNYVPSADASLKEMTIEGATLSPAFDPAVTEYVAYVPFEQRELTLRGVPYDEKAVGVAEKKVELDKAENIPAYEAVFDEETGDFQPVTTYAAEDRVVTLTCTAENGTTQQTYTVHIVRMPAYTGGVPQIHMTNESDLAVEEEIPEEDRPYEIPKVLELPAVGEVATKTAVFAGSAVVVVLMLLIGFLLGRAGRHKVVYEDDYDDDEELDEPVAPVKPAAKPVKAQKPVTPAKPEKQAKKARGRAYDQEDDDEFERLLESTPAVEHKLPQPEELRPQAAPVKTPEPVRKPEPKSAPVKKPETKPAPSVEDELSHMSLDDLLKDIKNM